MSVLAECFEVDIRVKNQLSVDTVNTSDSEIIQDYLKNLREDCSKLIDAVPIKSDNNNFVEIISVEKNSIFGIVGKSSKVEESIMRRIRNEDGDPVVSPDINLEDFRFFIFCIPTRRCAVVKNSPAPAFQKLFSDFLYKYKTRGISSIFIYPMKDNNINNKFNRFREIGKVDMIFAKGSSLQTQILSMKDTFDISESSLVKSSLTLELKNQSVSEDLKEFMSQDSLIESEFDKLEFTGTGDYENIETLEFVKKLLTLNVNIDIDYESLVFSGSHFEAIKKALLESLECS